MVKIFVSNCIHRKSWMWIGYMPKRRTAKYWQQKQPNFSRSFKIYLISIVNVVYKAFMNLLVNSTRNDCYILHWDHAFTFPGSALEVEKSNALKLEEKLKKTEEDLNQQIEMMAARQQLDAENGMGNLFSLFKDLVWFVCMCVITKFHLYYSSKCFEEIPDWTWNLPCEFDESGKCN